jgi:hypothetical protein
LNVGYSGYKLIFGQLILTRPDLAANRVRLLATKWNRKWLMRGAVRLRRTRTLSPCDPIFFYTAILWTGLHGLLAAVRPDG